MGQVYKPNLALSTSLIVSLLKTLQEEILVTNSDMERFDFIIFGVHVVISYVLSLRGSEGLMLNLTSTSKGLGSNDDFCTVALKGKVKGESAERDHVLPCSNVTSSGTHVRVWLEMLRKAHAMAKRSGGPAITSWNGRVLTTGHIDGLLHHHLFNLYEKGESFPSEIKNDDDICERFSVFRSLRRSSDTRALNQGVSPDDIDVVNRWKAVESAKGKKPSRSMRHHYAETALLKEPFLRYTKSM